MRSITSSLLISRGFLRVEGIGKAFWVVGDSLSNRYAKMKVNRHRLVSPVCCGAHSYVAAHKKVWPSNTQYIPFTYLLRVREKIKHTHIHIHIIGGKLTSTGVDWYEPRGWR